MRHLTTVVETRCVDMHKNLPVSARNESLRNAEKFVQQTGMKSIMSRLMRIIHIEHSKMKELRAAAILKVAALNVCRISQYEQIHNKHVYQSFSKY